MVFCSYDTYGCSLFPVYVKWNSWPEIGQNRMQKKEEWKRNEREVKRSQTKEKQAISGGEGEKL